MATYQPPKRATEYIAYIALDSWTLPGTFQVNPTLAAGDVKVAKDGGAVANLTTLPAVTPASSALVKVTLSATEMTADNVTVHFKDQTAPAEWAEVVLNIPTAARNIDDLTFPTVAGRSTNVAATGEVDADVKKVGGTTQTAGDIPARLPAALVSGRIDASVGAMAANVLTATAINADAITAAKVAADVATEIRSLASGTSDSGTDQTMTDSARSETTKDYWKGQRCVFTSGTLLGVSRIIVAFNASTDTMTFDRPLPVACSTQTYEIWPGDPRASQGLVTEQLVAMVSGVNRFHETVFVNGKWYAITGESSNPAQLVRFNTPRTDLTDIDTLTFAADGKHDYGQTVIYSETTGKLYCQFASGAGRALIAEVDPDTLATTDVVDDTTNPAAGGDGGVIAIQGSSIYYLQQSIPARILKYNLSGFAFQSSADLTALDNGHGLRATPDGVWLIADGLAQYPTSGWAAKINPSSLAFTSVTFDSDQKQPSGDFVIFGDSAWFGFQGNGDAATGGSLSKVLISDLSKTRINTGVATNTAVTAMVYALGSIWIGYDSSITGGFGSHLLQVNPETGEFQWHPSPSTATSPEEINTDGEKLYVTYYLSPAKVARLALTNPQVQELPANFAALAVDGSGQTTVGAASTDLDIYNARVTLIDDNGGTTDRYVVNWYKNGQDVVASITSPTIQVVKASDGSDLIAATAMTEIGTTEAYKYDATGGARIVAGAAYFVVVSATIDGATRTHRQGWGRDS